MRKPESENSRKHCNSQLNRTGLLIYENNRYNLVKKIEAINIFVFALREENFPIGISLRN